MIHILSSYKEIGPLAQLGAKCFFDDVYYKAMFPDRAERKGQLESVFQSSLEIALANGITIYREDFGRLTGFASAIFYERLKETSREDFNFVFPVSDSSVREETLALLDFVEELSPNLFLTTIAVRAENRRHGIGTDLIENLCSLHPDFNITSDISNLESLSLYSKLGFEIKPYSNDIAFVRKKAQPYLSL